MSYVAVATTTCQSFATSLITQAGTTACFQFISGAQPTNPLTAYTGTLLATIPLANPIGTAAGGTITITLEGCTIATTGTVAWARLVTLSSATTSIADFDVGTSGTAFTVVSTSLVQNLPLSMAGTFTFAV